MRTKLEQLSHVFSIHLRHATLSYGKRHRHFHLQTQLQDGSPITFSYISFSSFTFTGTPYRIFLLFLPWLPCHFYLVVIEQEQKDSEYLGIVKLLNAHIGTYYKVLFI